MRRPTPQTIAAIGVLAALAVVAMVTTRNAARDDDTYASTDYRGSGYRAWATLLAREGVTTERFILRPIELDNGIDTLVSAPPVSLAGDLTSHTAADVASLAAWVRGGGRLVYLGRELRLGGEEKLFELPYLLPGVGARGGLTGRLAPLVGTLAGLGTNRMLLVEHAGSAELSDGNGDIVVRYPFGRGEIVAVIDAVPFTNTNIATAGNARLAYLLAAPRRPGGVVAFDDGIHGALIDRPWYRALPIPIRVGLGGLTLALLLGLIGSALRGSPPLGLRAVREPTSVEFIDALAALYERVKARSAARAILARDALAAAARTIGLGDDVSPAELAARIGDRSDGVDVRRLVHALDAPLATDADLLAIAKLAHLVRKDPLYGGNRDGRRAAFAGRTRAHRRW